MRSLLTDLPSEILFHIASYAHDPYHLHHNIFQFRGVCKTFFQITESELFWRILVENQLACGFELHIWLHDLETRTRMQGGYTGIVEQDDFISIVNGWIDELIDLQMDSMVGKFLVRLAIGQDNLSHFGSVRVSACIRYLISKLFEPMLKLIGSIVDDQQQVKDKLIEPSDVFNMKIADFLSDNNLMSVPMVSHWVEVDYFNSLIPRQYFIWIVKYLSGMKIKGIDGELNASVWACQFLENTIGLQVTDMKFVNHLSRGKNFEREDFIPIFSTGFSLQFLAVWIGNLDLLQWCLEHRSESRTNRIDTFLSIGELKEEQSDYSTVSCYGSCYKRDNLGLTILHYAIRAKQVEIVKLLISRYRANPFQSLLISPAFLAYRMFSSCEDTATVEIYSLLKDTYKEHLEKHIESEKIKFDESSMKVFDLDETEKDDMEKLQMDKEQDENFIRLRKNQYVEHIDSYGDYYSTDDSSDEDEDEEFIDIHTLRKVSKQLPDIESEDPWVQYVEADNKLRNTVTDLLQDTENIIAHENELFTVFLRDRVGLNEKFKKRAFVEENENEYEPKFKKRKEMTFPKLFFNKLTKGILRDYRVDTRIAPSAQAILQQETESLTVELFKLTFEICNFFMVDMCMKHFVPGALNTYYGSVSMSNIDEESLLNHLITLSITEPSPENLKSLVSEINEHNEIVSDNYDIDDDPDYLQEGEELDTQKDTEKESGYESDWSDESEIGIEIFEDDDLVFYPSSIDEIERERKLSETILADEYSIKYEGIKIDSKHGFLIYSKDTHLIKRLITNLHTDTDLASAIGYELFYI